ncbi:MAG: ABC transporter ATP-binding protein [Chitinivibrionales bacterium]
MSEANSSAIEVYNLSKRFGEVEAVAGVSFAVNTAEIFGFLGPNGAGKTTTINMLIGLVRPLDGRIDYFGREYTADIKKAQHLMGVVPDESNLYPEMSGFENLCFCASLYGIGRREREQRAHSLLESFGLAQAAQRKFGGYSRGMKRRLTIAAGVIHQPGILFLDEPTSGIDVANARQIRALIASLKASGTTVFLTTHNIEEAGRLCDRIGFIVDGKIVQIDTTEDLLRQTQNNHIIELAVTKSLEGVPQGIEDEITSTKFELQSANRLRVITKTPLSLAPLITALEKRGIPVTEARTIKPDLEEVFVRITGIEAKNMKIDKERKNKQ